MRIVFLDTEFSRLPSPHDWPAPEKQIELLSAALVPLDQSAPVFYVELDVDLPQETSDFTRDIVIPLISTNCQHIALKIGREHVAHHRLQPESAAHAMLEYITSIGAHTVVCDAMIDFLLMSKLMKSISCEINIDYFLVKHWMLDDAANKRIDDFHVRTGLVPHHALVDAAALCEAYRSDIESLIDVELKR